MADPPTNQPCLTILGGPMAGTRLILEEKIDLLLGSDPSCRYCIPLPGVSPIHARIVSDDSGITVYEAGSPRGIYINDDRVVDQAPLRNGDVVWLGAPGGADVVMLQCRFAPRDARTPTAEADAPPVEATEVVFEEVPTVALPSAAPDTVRMPLPSSDDFLIAESPVAQPDAGVDRDADATIHLMQEPIRLAPEGGPPPSPLAFEDETQELAGAELRHARPTPEPEPTVAFPPPAAAVFEPPAAAPEAPAAPPSLPKVASPPTPPTPLPQAPPPVPPAPVPRARPPSTAPRPAAPRVKPAGPVAPVPPRAGSRGPLYAVLGLLAVAAVGGGVFAGLKYFESPPPGAGAPSPLSTAPETAPPVTVAVAPPVEATPEPAATPSLEEVVTIIKSPPPPPSLPSPSASPTRATPSPTPKAASPTPSPRVAATPAATPGPSAEALRAQHVTSLLGQAEAALSSQRYDAAVSAFDEALKLDAQNPRALQGRASALAARDAALRKFVVGKTLVQTAKVSKGLDGFDSSDVSVQKAPDFLGRLDIEVSPPSVKPGDTYVLRVYLVNEGKKPIKIAGITFTTALNGGRSGGAGSPRAKEVAPQQRALLDEISGVWKDGTTSWSTEVLVTANKGDSLKNQVVWR